VEKLQTRDDDQALTFTTENYVRKLLRKQLADKEAQKIKLEKTYPDLPIIQSLGDRGSSAGVTTSGSQMNVVSDVVSIGELQARVLILSNQLAEVEAEARQLGIMELEITRLQREKEMQESAYRNFAASLEQAKTSKQFEPSPVLNIIQIQTPTLTAANREKIQKIAAMVLFGGLGLAFGLAFVLEFYVDRSLKNPLEVEAKTGFPVFISIPWMEHNGVAGVLKGNGAAALLEEKNGTSPNGSAGATRNLPIVAARSADQTPGDSRQGLQPFYESLRDRLIHFFEIKNMTHKPKLVAVSSVAEGAGVSTIAAGLAASLSETGDGNVLLVDMNLQNGAAHHFTRAIWPAASTKRLPRKSVVKPGCRRICMW
jgi:hypothetical protein